MFRWWWERSFFWLRNWVHSRDLKSSVLSNWKLKALFNFMWIFMYFIYNTGILRFVKIQNNSSWKPSALIWVYKFRLPKNTNSTKDRNFPFSLSRRQITFSRKGHHFCMQNYSQLLCLHPNVIFIRKLLHEWYSPKNTLSSVTL